MELYLDFPHGMMLKQASSELFPIKLLGPTRLDLWETPFFERE
jgi:hypothetical protein